MASVALSTPVRARAWGSRDEVWCACVWWALLSPPTGQHGVPPPVLAGVEVQGVVTKARFHSVTAKDKLSRYIALELDVKVRG